MSRALSKVGRKFIVGELRRGDGGRGRRDVPLQPVLRQRRELLGHHGGGGAFREPETWAICRSNRAVGWS